MDVTLYLLKFLLSLSCQNFLHFSFATQASRPTELDKFGWQSGRWAWQIISQLYFNLQFRIMIRFHYAKNIIKMYDLNFFFFAFFSFFLHHFEASTLKNTALGICLDGLWQELARSLCVLYLYMCIYNFPFSFCVHL